MGANQNKQFTWEDFSEYRLLQKNLNDGTVVMAAKGSDKQFIGRELICKGKQEEKDIRRLIDQKVNSENQYLTKLVKTTQTQQIQHCYSNKLFYMLFQKPGHTLRDQILTRKFSNQKFTQQEASIILESGIKGLKTLKKLSQPHQNISTSSFFITPQRQIVLGDPWITPPYTYTVSTGGSTPLLQNISACPSPQKIQFQNDQIMQYCPYKADLFSMGMVILEALNFEHMDILYQKGFRRVIQQKVEQKIIEIKDPSLRQKLKFLLAFDPRYRQTAYNWYRTPSNNFTQSQVRRRYIGKMKNQLQLKKHQGYNYGNNFEKNSLHMNNNHNNYYQPINPQNLSSQPSDKYSSYTPKYQNYIPSQNTYSNTHNSSTVKYLLNSPSPSIHTNIHEYRTDNKNLNSKLYDPIIFNRDLFHKPVRQQKSRKYAQNYDFSKNQLSNNQMFAKQNKHTVFEPFIFDKKPQQTVNFGKLQGNTQNYTHKYQIHKSPDMFNNLGSSVNDQDNQVIMSTDPLKDRYKSEDNQSKFIFSAPQNSMQDHQKIQHIPIAQIQINDQNKPLKIPEIQQQSKESSQHREQNSDNMLITSHYTVKDTLQNNENKLPTFHDKTPVQSLDMESKQESIVLPKPHQFIAANRRSESQNSDKHFLETILKQTQEKSKVTSSLPEQNKYQQTPDRRPKKKYNSTIKQVSQSSYEQNSKQSQGLSHFGQNKSANTNSNQNSSNSADLIYVKQNYQTGFYQGQKKNGLRNGKGKFTYKEGSVYDGEWKDNMMNGTGILYYPSGKIAYQGQWKMDQFHGQGAVYNQQDTSNQALTDPLDYKNLDEINEYWVFYGGKLNQDRRHGKGKLKFSNGEIFSGQFVRDIAQGQGKYYRLNGQVIHGIWQHNKLIKIIEN